VRVVPISRSRRRRLRVLISGIGIAGPTLAWWLMRAGIAVTMVERAPAPRADGYMIDFWGVGYDVAERMDLIDELRNRGYFIDEVRFVNARGEKIGGLELESLRTVLNGRFFSILRGDLARALYDRIAGNAELIFGDTVTSIEERASDVLVEFERNRSRTFDLVIGADGLHSRVRELAFGPQEEFETKLGYYAASFFAHRYPYRDERAYVSYTSPRRHVARYALRDDRAAFLFVCVAPREAADPPDVRAQKDFLRRMFSSNAWEIDRITTALYSAEDLYFDRVSQIFTPRWSNGRVALVGDACFCPSLLAGQGAAFAMAGAYVLAHELSATPEHYAAAFHSYEERFRPFVDRKQLAARRIGSWFAPRSKLGLAWRNGVSALLSIPFVMRQTLGSALLDRFELPDFERMPALNSAIQQGRVTNEYR
jgi:2-polyprenyl-6-methoxyphenol hydroxylase-like FAD-dependent oxidoreductase